MEANASITFEMTIFLIKSEIEIKSELAKFAVITENINYVILEDNNIMSRLNQFYTQRFSSLP